MTLAHETYLAPSAAEIEEHKHLLRSVVEDRLAAIDLRPQPFQRFASVETWDLGDLLISDWDCPALEGTRSRRTAGREADALLLFTASEGRQIIETDHEAVTLRPGGFVIMTTRTSARIVVPETLAKRTVRIPLSALSAYDIGRGLPECVFLDNAHNPLAGLAHDYVAGLGAQIDQMSPTEVEGARNALLVLVAGMIRASQGSEAGETDFLPLLRHRMETWIIEHLMFGAIRVRDLAQAHNVASRTVHRAFAATGDTVGAVVRSHRIAAARDDLITTASSISTIAHRWGFCDASHLGREFRREYSMSPGDFREAYSVV
jgi:AraC-like DNA-binding protein